MIEAPSRLDLAHSRRRAVRALPVPLPLALNLSLVSALSVNGARSRYARYRSGPVR